MRMRKVSKRTKQRNQESSIRYIETEYTTEVLQYTNKTGQEPEPKAAPQWAMARVKSFVAKSKGTWGEVQTKNLFTRFR